MFTRSLGVIIIVCSISALIVSPAWSQEKTDQSQESAQPQTSAPATEESQASQPAEQSAVQIEDAVVSQDVVDRAPVGSSDVIAKETESAFCFTRVVGAVGNTQITHNWYYKGALKASVVLDVRSPNWRTWSKKSMSPDWVGEWMVEILSADGAPLESIIFFVE